LNKGNHSARDAANLQRDCLTRPCHCVVWFTTDR